MNKTQGLLVALITIFFTLSCSNNEEQITNDTLLDMSKIEMTTEGMQKVIDYFNKNSDYEFNGELISAGFISYDKSLILKNNIDTENVILLEIISKNGKLINVYSSPSSKVENEVIVFTESKGIITNEIKFNFTENSDGSTNFSYEFATKISAKSAGWGDCMQDFFSDSYIGTITGVLGVASGVGCIPCGGAAAFFTGVAALGCLG